MSYLSVLLAHSYRHRHTHPSLPLLLTSVVHLGHYRRREGGERENERKQKRGREGERGLVFTRLTHPHLPLYHSVLVLSIPCCTDITEALLVQMHKKKISTLIL